MIDIKLLRENPDLFRNDLRKRGKDTKIVDELLECDKEWRKKLHILEEMRAKRNKATIELSEAKKKNMDIGGKIAELRKLSDEIDNLKEEVEEFEKKRREIWMRIPNLLDESVPVGKDDSENVEIREWGEKRSFEFEPKDHQDIGRALDLMDVERAAKISGARFYYLKRDLVLLEMAILRFTMDFLVKKGFVPIEPPFMMRRRPYEGVTDLSDFEEVMYKVENEDLYMIATSEHPLVAMHMDEVLPADRLPLKYVGISPCFRMEAGTHGRDTKGIFRVHQFNKVEQIVFCKQEDSKKMHEELLKNSEEIFQSLGIHYRVVDICTGDIGTVASKKYDIEAWLPGQGKYREMVSCSNCTDYQARRLGIRYEENGERRFVHTLNSTGIASPRALIAIMENYQNVDGSVTVPDVLVPYFGKKKIPS